MKNKHGKNKKENPLKELDIIKLKKFEDLENQYFSDIKLEDFQKERLKEFNDIELGAFKEFIKDSKTDICVENLKLELNSDDTIKSLLKDLQSIGIDGKGPLRLLKMLKKLNL